MTVKCVIRTWDSERWRFRSSRAFSATPSFSDMILFEKQQMLESLAWSETFPGELAIAERGVNEELSGKMEGEVTEKVLHVLKP